MCLWPPQNHHAHTCFFCNTLVQVIEKTEVAGFDWAGAVAGFRVQGFVSRAEDLGARVWGVHSVSGLGFRVGIYIYIGL